MVKTLGDRIKELRGIADLSLRELSPKVGGLSPAFLSDIELGRRFPSDEVLEKLSKALKTTFDDLKEYDTRAPVQEMKRLAAQNPALGVAFRKMVQMSPDELLKLVSRSPKHK